ncbi:MAG: YihY/virulence factor BrkB family protein [Clostridiaceae bacterium]|nr:YihY/virulence factor BrkB family protein [Clostridiaceae bacterium]
MRKAKFIRYIKSLYIRFYKDDIPALGAQLAYYFLLSFFPFLILLITIISYTPISSEDVLKELAYILPESAFELIEESVFLGNTKVTGQFLSFGFIAMLWTASNGIGAAVRCLNKAYDVEEKRPFWQIKFMSVFFTIALAIVILLSFVLLIFGQHVGIYLAGRIGIESYFYALWNVIRYISITLIIIMVFAAFYRYVPNRRLCWREVLPGAVFTTISWIIASMGFAFYVNNFGTYSIVYGSLGGAIVLLVWLFLSSMIILMGGELNATLAFDREKEGKPHEKH